MKVSNPDVYNHPIFNPFELCFNTRAMEQLKEDVHRWLWTGTTGALVIGPPRVGKTTAVIQLIHDIHNRAKVTVPTYYVSISKRDQPTITSLFRILCQSQNLRTSRYDRADHLSNRIINYIADKAVVENCSQAVLIVDEMQRLRAFQFDAFAEIYDELRRMKIRLLVIFVGNNLETQPLIKQIEQPNYSHIHGRFFNHITSFPGLTSKYDVGQCLAQYDSIRFPVDGPTYTEYFLPNAVKSGWRFKSLSGDIWRVFYKYKRKYKIASWGMHYFITTVNTLLIDFLDDRNIDNIDDEVIHECIRISGIIPELVKEVT